MAGQQELRKRLRSVKSAWQLASAMRTAATAKYARVGRAKDAFAPYAKACRELYSVLGGAGLSRPAEASDARDCLILFGGNRGMCGGFNAELGRYLDVLLPEYDSPRLISCGRKMSAHLRELGAAFEERPLQDIPAYGEIRALTEELIEQYESEHIARVFVVYQSFRNMLVQSPACVRLLPEEGMAAHAELPYLFPDRAAVEVELARRCLSARLYELALENAAGAQAATLMAMRSACDNAEASARELEVTINRHRQAEITSGVIETASGSIQQGD